MPVTTIPESVATAAIVEEESSSGSEPEQTVPRSPCGGENVRIIPTQVYQQPIGDGWKVLIVELAVSNQSQSWASTYWRDMRSITITSEDGYSYNPDVGLEISQDSTTPYAGEILGMFNASPLIPPGFVITNGDLRHHPYYVAFKVAESQNSFRLQLANTSISCLLPDGSFQTVLPDPVELDLDRDVVPLNLARDERAGDLPPMFSSFELSGKGTVDFLSANRVAFDDNIDIITLRFRFTSKTGYDTQDNLRAYLIVDDTVWLLSGCNFGSGFLCPQGFFSVGPGQSTDVELGFGVWKDSTNLKLIWHGITDTSPSEYQVLQLGSG
jgi:hypothetical protein